LQDLAQDSCKILHKILQDLGQRLAKSCARLQDSAKIFSISCRILQESCQDLEQHIAHDLVNSFNILQNHARLFYKYAKCCTIVQYLTFFFDLYYAWSSTIGKDLVKQDFIRVCKILQDFEMY
jgi:hypothetical protein